MKHITLAGVCVLMCASVQGQSTLVSASPNEPTSQSLEARAEQMPDASSYQVLTRLKNPDVLTYTDNVLVAVQRKWYDLTSRAERAPGGKSGTTVIDFKISRNGSLSDPRLVESYGEKTLDDFAIEGIRRASPFAALPSAYEKKSLELRFRFTYNLEASDDRPPSCGVVRNGVYRPGGAVKAPHAVYTPDLEYSEEARQARYLGLVFLGVTVGVDESTSDICIARAAGNGLDEKAIEALRSWRFDPGTKDGVPVPTRVLVQTSFHLY
jgi:TonB family protein